MGGYHLPGRLAQTPFLGVCDFPKGTCWSALRPKYDLFTGSDPERPFGRSQTAKTAVCASPAPTPARETPGLQRAMESSTMVEGERKDYLG